MQKEETMVNGGSTACHGVNLDLDLNLKVFNISLFISFFVLQLLLMYHGRENWSFSGLLFL